MKDNVTRRKIYPLLTGIFALVFSVGMFGVGMPHDMQSGQDVMDHGMPCEGDTCFQSAECARHCFDTSIPRKNDVIVPSVLRTVSMHLQSSHIELPQDLSGKEGLAPIHTVHTRNQTKTTVLRE